MDCYKNTINYFYKTLLVALLKCTGPESPHATYDEHMYVVKATFSKVFTSNIMMIPQEDMKPS